MVTLLLLLLQELQFVKLHPVQAELPADWVVVTWPPGPVDLETNPHLDINRARSWLLHSGHWGVSLPITRDSKLLLQALQVYS